MLASHTSSVSIIAAFDALPQAVFVVEALRPGHANAFVNAAYAALTGYSAAEAVAPGFDATAIFADPETVSGLAEATQPESRRVSVRRRDGTTVEAILHVRGIRHADGSRHVAGLLAPVAVALPVSALPDAAGKSAFLSWLNHELRSPLNACGMWLDVLALAPQADKLAKAVDAIKRNLARQTRLVNDLNDAARVAADGIELKRATVELVPLLERGLDAWQAQARAKPLSLEHRIELRDARLDGDAQRLLQALNHVLENAIGSTPSGGRVELRAYRDDGLCIVEVDDAGVPLSDEDAAQLGTPLWRSPHSAKSRAGLGLGLAVAHHIVTQHGGSLTASSGAAGTRFVLTLPLAASSR